MSRYSAKKDRVTKYRNASGITRILVPVSVIAGLMFLAIAVLLFEGRNRTDGSSITVEEAFPRRSATSNVTAPAFGVTMVRADESGGGILLPAAQFDDGKARFFRHEISGKSVKFFVVRSSDGVIRAAFDACDVCYRAKLGYRQQGDLMVCNNCGQEFPSVKINVEKGGCNPSPLERTVAGENVVITLDALDDGLYLF